MTQYFYANVSEFDQNLDLVNIGVVLTPAVAEDL